MSNYSLKEQINSLNSSVSYYEKKITSCKDKVSKFEDIQKKYPNIEYYGGKIFYLPEPSLAKKITFDAGNLNSIDHRENYRSANALSVPRNANEYIHFKMLYSYFLDNDLKIICNKNIILVEKSKQKRGYLSYSDKKAIEFEVKDYSAFFDKSTSKDKLVKSAKKLLMKYLLNISNNCNITLSNNSFDKEKIQGMLLFK